jgi:hypothetical protein
MALATEEDSFNISFGLSLFVAEISCSVPVSARSVSLILFVPPLYY